MRIFRTAPVTPPALSAPTIATGLPAIGALFGIVVPFTAGVAGTPDDIEIYNANAPFKFRILILIDQTITAIGASTVSLRTATGGGGVLAQSASSGAALTTAIGGLTGVLASSTIAKGGSLYLRRSDRGVSGQATAICIREA